MGTSTVISQYLYLGLLSDEVLYWKRQMDNYPNGNAEIIKAFALSKHPEGGYFVQTDQQVETVPSPFAKNEPRRLATSIYYLLTPDSPSGVIHMNKSVTYHVLHQGRAEYTLITPGVNGQSSTVERKIMGTNSAAGELRMLLVGTGIWKMSRLLPQDLALCTSPEGRDKVGCFITEVVVPGFEWEDHQFLTCEKLEELLDGTEEKEENIRLLRLQVKRTEG